MSDLVGNPEDRFSHNQAHILFIISICVFACSCLKSSLELFCFGFGDMMKGVTVWVPVYCFSVFLFIK